ncbi:MAG: PspA/IM30 family protein [Singulisphaera sp.]|nr:PspA/IM30 family protein [Singulisphaera sp.]
MILGKFWRTLKAQLNKLANGLRTADPIAQMQYEYDVAVAQIKEGRQGLEQYRALVDRVGRQVEAKKAQVTNLEAKVKAYLLGGDRDTAARYALELQKAKKEHAEEEAQLERHEEAYNNSLTKIKHASGKLATVRDKISRYDAELKTSRAEAEITKLAQELNIDVTSDFGQIEQVVQDKIGANRAKARVAADLSLDGVADIQHEQQTESLMAAQALREFEVQAGLVPPENTPALETPNLKQLGPASRSEGTASQG